MTESDYLNTWDYLQTLKIIYEQRAIEAEAREKFLNDTDTLSQEYRKDIARITTIQDKIMREAHK